jgi:transposase
MPKKKLYTKDFRSNAVRVYQEGNRPMTEVARELGVTYQTFNGWVKAAEGSTPEAVKRPGTETTAQELARLRQENQQLRMERDFLKKAAAFFAKSHQ